MATGVYVYREIADPSPSLAQWLDQRGQLFEIQDPKGKNHLYIENDIPRDADINEEIVGREPQRILDGKGRAMTFPGVKGCTVGFALFAENRDEGTFDHIGTYRSLDRAESAARNAKVVVRADVDTEAPDETWDSMETEKIDRIELRNLDPEDDE